MDPKRAKPDMAAKTKKLEAAGKQIAALKKKHLPAEPHLLNVPSDDPFRTPYYHHEYAKLPFAPNEVKALQYMTMISDGDRGVAAARGNWHDEIYNQSPGSAASGSSSATPNAGSGKEAKKPKAKISFADYKNFKEKGIKPSPRPIVESNGRVKGHERNSSQVTGTPMSGEASMEGMKGFGVAPSDSLPPWRQEEAREAAKESEKLTASRNPASAPEKTRPANSGHVDSSKALDIKGSKSKLQSQSSQQPQPTNGPTKHVLPPRPQSPPRKTLDPKSAEPKQQKRPLESGDTQPEKRTKIEHSRTPSNSFPRKPLTPGNLLPGWNKKRATPETKDSPLNRPSHTPKPSEKPKDLPPLLSPLPADLDSSPTTKSLSGFKKSDSGRLSSQNTPSRFKGSDTIIVKESKKSRPVDSSPLSPPPKSPLAPLPTLLSPTLPPIVEDELVRLQQKSAEKAEKTGSGLLNTADRYEKARQPDTPGVARKTVTPKIGHPPKKNQGESSKSKLNGKDSHIVKLKYKKRQKQDIQRILGLKPRPSKEFLEFERKRLAKTEPAPAADSSDEDLPLSRVASKTAPSSVFKKRSSDSFESRSSEPASKRPRGPDTIDVAKSRTTLDPPFKSPALSAPSQKNLLSTPKKSDALKSTAMRRVESNDTHSRTPQTSTSTPASAEKPRLNGDHSQPSQSEDARLASEAFKLKRQMDSLLKTKGGDRSSITDAEKKLGICDGLEALVKWMLSWRLQEARGKPPLPSAWIDGVKLWEFINNNYAFHFPVLAALSYQIGALLREEVNAIYIRELQGLVLPNPNQKDKEKEKGKEQVEKDREREKEIVHELSRNSTKMQQVWVLASQGRDSLRKLGVTEVLGPWSTGEEVAMYAGGVVERFKKREKLDEKEREKERR